jgi:hypothetical protein
VAVVTRDGSGHGRTSPSSAGTHHMAPQRLHG